MSMADALTALKSELQQTAVSQIVELLTRARQAGQPLHEVEEGLWDLLLKVGRSCLDAFFASHGSGDLGETVTLPDGRQARRLKQVHARRYVSIFGEFVLQRTVYGSREGQSLGVVRPDLEPFGIEKPGKGTAGESPRIGRHLE